MTIREKADICHTSDAAAYLAANIAISAKSEDAPAELFRRLVSDGEKLRQIRAIDPNDAVYSAEQSDRFAAILEKAKITAAVWLRTGELDSMIAEFRQSLN